MGHLLGFARVSATDQQPHLRVDALKRAGRYRVFTEPSPPAASRHRHAVLCHLSACLLPPDGRSVRSDRDEGGLQVPRYLLINGTEPRWRLHDTMDSADLEKSLTRVMENGAITYTLASRNEGETFQSLTINGKTLVTYVITEEDDPDPAKTRSRYEAAGF
jgi:hypothetical protein